ncbi:hypothetical protein COOONC_03892 [Cooperia oncophora]
MRFELLLLLTLLPLCVAADTCYYKGKTRSKYEKWVDGHFQLECNVIGEHQTIRVIGCASDRGTVVRNNNLSNLSFISHRYICDRAFSTSGANNCQLLPV